MTSSETPERLGHATSIHGDHLTIFANPFGPGEVAFDDEGGGPYHKVTGCPNCGKHAGEWLDPLAYVGGLNAGRDRNEPCTRACRYQLEWQAEVAARRLTEAS